MSDNLQTQLASPGNTSGKLKSVDETTAILAYVVTAGFLGLLFVLSFHKPPESNLAMLNIVLGSFGTAWLGAMAYFFGAAVNRAKGANQTATDSG